MGILILVGAILATVFAAIESAKAWGGGAAAGVGVGGGILTLFIPFGAIVTLIGCVIIFGVARSEIMKKIANEPDDPPPGPPPALPPAAPPGPQE